MTQIRIREHKFDVDAIVFDKDGTLIDLDAFWAAPIAGWVRTLRRDNDLDDEAVATIYRTLGYDPVAQHVIANSPYAVASMSKIYTILAGLLYQYGVGWESAETQVAALEAEGINGKIEPIGAVTKTIQHLAAAGIRIVIATSDNRSTTLQAIQVLDIQPNLIVCGDDPLPNKPSPAVFAHIAEMLNILPSRMIMVGDSEGDMETGRNGDAAAVVGIGGVRSADINLASIDEIYLGLQRI